MWADEDEGGVAGGGFVERMQAARAAFDEGDWSQAADSFAALERDFGTAAEAQEAIAAHRGLHALAAVRAGQDPEATLPLMDRALGEESTPPPARDLLRWFKAVILFQREAWEDARTELMAYFRDTSHDRDRRFEALLLAGTTYQRAGDAEGAAAFFTEAAENLERADAALAARARLLRFQSLLDAGQLEAALEVFREEGRDGEVADDEEGTAAGQPRVITMHMLALRLGSEFLEEGRYHEAIVCLQRVWNRERLLQAQRDRVGDLQRQRAQAAANPDGAAEVARLDAALVAVAAEIESLEENPGFDAGVRFRLARGWLGLGRHHESATVLREMVANLPADELVEAAALPLMQSWIQAGRWQRAEETAALYERRFGGTDLAIHHPEMLLLLAVAREADSRYLEAADACASLVALFADAPQAAVAAFKEGYLRLMGDELEEGLALLADFPRRFPDHPLREDAAYWQAEAQALLGHHEEARELFADYLEAVEQGEWAGDYVVASQFRRAFSRFALADYAGAIEEFRAFLEEHPTDPYADEAWLLKGDALGGEGELDAALAAYRAIRPTAPQFYEEGIFKQVNIHRMREDFELAEELLRGFLEERPDSARVAEAVYELGRLMRAQDREEEADEVWWEAAISLGNRPEQNAVEDLFSQLARLHRLDPQRRASYLSRLRAMIVELSDDPEGSALVLCRLHWARGRFYERDDEVNFRTEMIAAAEHFDPRRHNPRLGVDIAEALYDAGLHTPAVEMLRELRRWNPRMLEKDRLFATLLRGSLALGDAEAALEAAERFAAEALSPPPALRAEVDLEKARLLAPVGRREEALDLLRELQGERAVPARLRAEAFLETGNLLREADPRSAAPYYERVYLAFGGFPDLASTAYEERARILLGLGMRAEARQVVEDWLAQAWLEEHPDLAEQARLLDLETR